MESKRIEELRVRQSSFIAAFVKISWLCFCDRVARWRVCLKVGRGEGGARRVCEGGMAALGAN